MRIAILIIFFGFFSGAFAQNDVTFIEGFSDSAKVDADTILLVGVGSSATRIFLNNLSQRIINSFAESKITCTYAYMGKTAAEAKKQFDTSSYKDYKAVLCLMPDSASIFEVHNTRAYHIWLADLKFQALYTTISTEILNEQSFTCRLYVKREKIMQIWNGFLEVSCNPVSIKAAIKACDMLMANLRSTKVIN